MGLNISIGALTVVLAVVGGIVSAHPPKNPPYKWACVSVFVGCGLAALVLIIVQAVKTERAATLAQEQQKQMADLLEQSRIDEAHMKGQLDTLQATAGKIGENSGAGFQALVGAVDKVASSGVVGKSALGKMTNDQLREAVKKWADGALEFNSAHDSEWEREFNAMWQGQIKATNQQAKALAQQKLAQWEANSDDNFELEFRERFVGNGIALREELRRRLGPLPEVEPGSRLPLALDNYINTPSIKATASYLEWVSKELP